MNDDIKIIIISGLTDYLDFHMDATEETYRRIDKECKILEIKIMRGENNLLNSEKDNIYRIIRKHISKITYQHILYDSTELDIPFSNLFFNIEKSIKMVEYLDGLGGISEKVIEQCNSFIKNAKALKFFYANGEIFDYREYKIKNDFNLGNVVSVPLGKAICFSFFENYENIEAEKSIYIRVGQQELSTCLLELCYAGRNEVNVFANYEGKYILLKSLQANDGFWVCDNLDMVFKNELLSGFHFSVYIPQGQASSPLIGNIGSSLGVYVQKGAS